jgi:RNA recognition motif-containing protein
MVKTLFVGNLPFNVTEEEVSGLFKEHGTVQSVKIIKDRETGRSRGFAFVEMEAEEAQKAIQALDGTELEGRALRINEAKEKRNDRPNNRQRY